MLIAIVRADGRRSTTCADASALYINGNGNVSAFDDCSFVVPIPDWAETATSATTPAKSFEASSRRFRS